jgi:phage-related protein
VFAWNFFAAIAHGRYQTHGRGCFHGEIINPDRQVASATAVVAVQLGKKVYVLHAFQKESKKGVATPKQDVELIKRRYAEARELAKHEE